MVFAEIKGSVRDLRDRALHNGLSTHCKNGIFQTVGWRWQDTSIANYVIIGWLMICLLGSGGSNIAKQQAAT